MQLKPSSWFLVISISSKPEPAIWLRKTGQRVPWFDRYQLLITTWMSNIKYVRCKRRLNASVHRLVGVLVWLPRLELLLVCSSRPCDQFKLILASFPRNQIQNQPEPILTCFLAFECVKCSSLETSPARSVVHFCCHWRRNFSKLRPEALYWKPF